ncbi:MAG TPA: helix-turn-helix domain-containing protein [Polyangiaceae bacterium]
MPGVRSYGDPCGIARALDVIGERWALLIVRELAFGPKRFTDLRGALGASPNVLSQRLGELEEAGVVQRRSAGAALYELTDWGRELHPILVQLGRWGAHSKLRPRGALSVDSLMLALEATFVPDAAPELVASYELRLGEDQFSVDIDRGSIAIARGHERRAVAILETEPETLRAVVFGEQKLADAPVVIRGDARLGRLFFRLFSRP